MSNTLKLGEHLLVHAKNHQTHGRPFEAHKILKRLAGFRILPSAVANETLERLAEIALDRKKFRTARKHLTAALALQPTNDRYLYLMAIAHAESENGDAQTAAEHYRASLESNPDQPDCLADYGRHCLRIGQMEEGFQCLRQAVELAPNDLETLNKLVDALEEHGEFEEAERTLRSSLFRNSRDARFRRMWDDFRFREAWRKQVEKRRNKTEEGPTVLPFVRPPLKIVRRDRPSAIAGPHETHCSDITLRQA